MSSSVFVETARSASESLLNGGSTVANADSNLVVVYGKNGINVDRKGLENLIDEKTLTSISVIRITSPTPSMQDEEEEEIRKEVERNEDDGEKSVASDDEDDEADRSESEDTERVSKQIKIPAKTRPQILGLTVEEFYPPDAAKELAKEILKYAGVTPLKCNVDYEFQRYVIQNDHCYTPYTSPSQLNKAKPFEEEDDKHQQSVRKPPGTGTTVKQYLNKRKQLMDEKQRKLNEKERSIASASDNEELVADDERINESQEDEADEDLDEDDSDYSEESEKSAESENDRDSDLDFDVNNRHGRKRKTAAVRRKKKERKDKKEKQRARSVMMQKTISKRRQHSQDNNTHDDETKVVLTPMKVNRQPLDARKSISAFNSVKGIARKQMPENVDVPVSGPPLPPPPSPAAVSSTQSKPLINIQSIQVIPAPKPVAVPAKQIVAITAKPIVSIAPAKPIVSIPPAKPVVAIPAKTIVANPPKPIEVAPVKQKAIASPTVPQSPQTVKQIVINKVIASPKGGFTDLSTLLARSDNLQSNLRVKEIKPEKPASASPVKGFMRLGIDTAAKNQLPAQISIQTHQSSSEIAAENDKQLDLIDSLVKDEMENSFKESNKPPMKENSIPDLVKMLESTEKAVLEKNKLSSSFTSSSVEAIDIANAPLLETPDDEIPDDLLQHVVELMEDKSLQEAVEKEVLQQQQKQQQQKQQQQPTKPIHLPQPQVQQIILPQPVLQPVRQPQIVTAAVMKQPKSIIEASISNTTTPSSSRDTTPTPTLNRTSNPTFVRKEPIQIVRGNGRVITLPPIEAPTTRAKRRAQAQPSADISFNDSESCDVSMHSDTSIFAETSVLEKSDVPPVITPLKERVAVVKATTGGKKKTATRATKAAPPKSNPEQEGSQEDEDEDDPNKLWCICRQPHNNRFMICCDVCEDWFHGTCVSITKAMGLEMELKGVDWTCPKCVKKQETRKQRKITDIFDKKTIIQDVQKLDGPPKQAAVPTQSTTSTTITVTELPAEKRHLIDFKKLQPGQFYAITKVDTTKKVQSLTETSSIVTTVTTTPTTTVATTLMTPEPVQKKFTDLQVKKTTEPAAAAAATTSNVTTKRVIMLPSTAKTTTSRGMTMVKASAAQQQQQLKFTKVPTAAEKKQFTVTKAHQQQQQQQNKNITQTTAEGAISEGNQKVPTSKQAPTELLTCIVCKKPARANSIYCSDDCIRKHAQNALINVSRNAVKSPEPVTPLMPVKLGPDEKKKKNKGLFEDLLSMADRKPKVERVYVFERRTGRILTGNNAPTTINLKKWLQDNPTFEVVQPGSPQAIEVERSKQKTRLSMQSPTNTNSTFMPLKADGAVVTSVITISPPVISTPPPVLPKIIKVQVDNKSNTKPAHSPTIHQPQRTSTSKQLPKYPQQVSIKPDKATSSPSHKVLKKQVSAEKESPVAQTPNRTEFEPVRVNVRRTLKEQLLLRMNDLADDSKLTTEQVEEFVKATELEMYRLFNKDIGTKYKAKYRSLMFNIKDRKNETLFQKICGKLIEPRQLVRMSPEEMASQELAQWRENEAKHQLEMIKKSELDMLSCAKNYVLKTHKGEEVIEGKATDRVDLDISIPVEDVVTVLNNATVSSTTEIEASLVTPRKDHSFDLDSSINFAQEVTPSSATSSSDKKKASSKERDKEKRHKSKDRHREKSRKRSRSRSRERHHKSTSRKDERRDKEERVLRKEEHDLSAKIPKLVAPLKVVVPPPTSTVVSKPAIIPTKLHKEREVGVKKSTKAPIEKFNLIDQILESTKTVEEAANLLKNHDKKEPVVAATANTSTPTSTATPLPPALPTPPAPPSNSIPHSPTAMDSDQEPSSTVSISTPPEDPYYKYSSEAESSIWTGSINMIDVASYQVSVQTVSGNTYLLSKDLPEELDVVGRISPDTVWDYIGKIKRSPNKEIVIIRLVPAAESENVAYTILYKYLDKRKRLGVIKTTSPNIKDFYIMPLGVGQQMPSVLQPNENFEFYDDTMRPDMLLGIVIRIMGKRHSNAAIRRKKEASVISNRVVTSVMDADGSITFTPPGSPKSRTADTSRAGGSRIMRMPQKSMDDDEIDIDAIIKAPITSKKAQAPVAGKRDDADEPYSPGGSSDDDVQVVPLGVRDDDLKREMDEINRQIAAQKMEIAGLLSSETTSFKSGSNNLAPSLADISIPSNLQQILASIQSKPESPALPSSSSLTPSMVPPPPMIGSLARVIADDEEEYTPEPMLCTRNTRDSQPSRLAQLSEAELLSMVPDDINIDNSNSSHSEGEPPEKRPRWSEPPPPGLEGEYN